MQFFYKFVGWKDSVFFPGFLPVPLKGLTLFLLSMVLVGRTPIREICQFLLKLHIYSSCCLFYNSEITVQSIYVYFE